MKKTAFGLALLGLSLLVVGLLYTPGRAQAPPANKQAGGPPPGFPDLVKGLKASPGCLGVDAARTSSGKQVIFAWFENKKAVLAWYYSEMHQGAMKSFFPGYKTGTPMKDIKDDDRPFLVIASLTPAEKAQVDGTKLPISQIAIELYNPAPGGVALGGRFAPSALKVPGLRDVPLTGK